MTYYNLAMMYEAVHDDESVRFPYEDFLTMADQLKDTHKNHKLIQDARARLKEGGAKPRGLYQVKFSFCQIMFIFARLKIK